MFQNVIITWDVQAMFLCSCRIFIQTLMDQSCAYWHFVFQSTNSRRTKRPVQGQQTHLPSHKTCWLSSGEFLQGLHQLDSWEESIKKALLKVYKSCKVDRCHFHHKRKGILRQVSKYKHVDCGNLQHNQHINFFTMHLLPISLKRDPRIKTLTNIW